MLPYCVCILLSEKDGKFYIGFTEGLEMRLADHRNGRVKSTKARRPLRLIFAEYYAQKSDAIRREDYLNTSAGKRALKMMLRDTLNLPG